ncbi:MAG TPA: RDD family protein [bacterium]
MRCAACGYLSLERSATCLRCGAAAGAGRATQPQLPFVEPAPDTGDAPAPRAPDADGPVPAPPAESRGSGRKRKRRAGGRTRASAPGPVAPPAAEPDQDADESLEVSDDDLDVPLAAPAPVPARGSGPAQPRAWLAPPADLEEPELPSEGAPVIDRVEEIPPRFWAPQAAGLVRRTVAVLVDQLLLAALLGLFIAAGALALWREGFGFSSLLSGAGLEETLGPLALLAVLAGAAYHVPAIALAGRTPGKRLAGLEVRAQDGSVPSWGRAALRWCGALLGLACGGAGLAWALFEPRRRGWADLVSDTLVVGRDPGAAVEPPGVDIARGGGYHAPAVQGRDSSAGRATD